MLKHIISISFLFFVVTSFGQDQDSAKIAPVDETIYTTVDTLASFPGGKPAWINFISKNLDANVGVDNGAKRGTYNVKIRFTVTKDGELKDFQPLSKYKHGFEDEVIRVLKLSPNWVPAKKDGKYVNSKFDQVQTFVISKG